MSLANLVFDKIVSALHSLLHGRPFTREAVASQLDARAKERDEVLNWRESIVDLLKLLGQDSDLEARKDLAEDLGYTGVPDGSATMNVWLIEKTLQRIADHYVDVPGATNTR